MEQILAKTIISSYFDNGWFNSNYNMNIYKGCNHGCIYCDSRSDCYRIENFDQVKVKKDALKIINNDLKSKRKKGMIFTGSMSDPYNSFEEKMELTRGALKLIKDYRFGVAIVTKSDLVLRDIDLLKEINQYNDVAVGITITTIDDNLSGKIERQVPNSSERFEVIRQLRAAGIKAGILLTPLLPFINDTQVNIKGIVQKAVEVDANWVYVWSGFGVTLRNNQREHYYMWLDKLFPGLKEKYQVTYGNSYWCQSLEGTVLWQEFTRLCQEKQIPYHMKDICNRYFKKDVSQQLTLF